MVKKLLFKKLITLYITFLISLFMLGGCTYVDKVKEINSTPAIMVIPAEKFQQIDMIELKKADDEAPVKPETAEPEKGRVCTFSEECVPLCLRIILI
jgi:hypothetical protein